MIEFVKVPTDRIKTMDSRDKKFKNKIEEFLGVSFKFSANSVEIKGESLEVLRARDIVKAVARGFSPARAERLLKEEEMLTVIELEKLSENRLRTISSRIIGTNGKTRKRIEEKTHTYVSVYGKTVSIIGNWDETVNAKKAIKMLINGSEHKSVYRFLETLKL